VFESAFGFAITITVKIVDIAVIMDIVTLFTGKDHDAFGTHEIHAGIKKMLTKVITTRNERRYRMRLPPLRVLNPCKCPYTGSHKCLGIHIPGILCRK
jgi:hypothetical protein